MIKIKFVLFFAFIFSFAYTEKIAYAQKPNVLDFDADVIEGERKTPSVFLEIGAENPTMDSVIFQRNDFNDLHSLDSKRRQQYQPLYSK